MNSKELEFLVSALTEQSALMATDQIERWIESRRNAHRFDIRRIGFDELVGWSFDSETGNLKHHTGKFFSIEGISVKTTFGPVAQWSQPIINQPEVGILGFLTKKFDDVLHFLMQAKMEPGNINMVQFAPTLQATRSNFTRAHGGKTPPYLEYFIDDLKSRVLVDTSQSEQGARFLRKRNRNVIVETNDPVTVLDDYCWLTLGQIYALIQSDNRVNMDARTVLSCIPFSGQDTQGQNVDTLLGSLGKENIPSGFRLNALRSALNAGHGMHGSEDINAWFTKAKARYDLEVTSIPLRDVRNWHTTEHEISHEENKYFSIIAVAVEADNREVPQWTQPLVKPHEEGVVAYLTKHIGGVLHFLVQAKVEPGNIDVVEMAPTVQCITGSYRQARQEDRPAFLDYVLNVDPKRIRSSTLQSEEGGRFYREENRNLIIEVEDDFPEDVPENYIWMTLNQLQCFIRYNNFVNVEGRCLLSCLGLL